MMIKIRGGRLSHRKMTRKSSLEKSNYGEGGGSSPRFTFGSYPDKM